MAHSLLSRLDELPLVFFDTETTGLSPARGDRVIEIGIVRVEAGRLSAEYQRLVDPGRDIEPIITRITGITPDMLRDQPPFAEILEEIIPLFRGAIMLGHNLPFDLSFLKSEFRHAGRRMTSSLGADTLLMDTLSIARRRFGRGGNTLEELARRLKVGPGSAHRALADAHVTRGVFDRLMEPLGGGACCLCDALMQQGGAKRLDRRIEENPISRTNRIS